MNRVQKLQAQLYKTNKLQQILITKPVNLNYLAGLYCFTPEGREGLAYINSRRAWLFISPLIYDQLLNNSIKIRKIKNKLQLYRNLKKLLIQNQGLGFEEKDLRWKSYQDLKKILTVKLEPTNNLIENIRCIKEPEEIVQIKKACQINEKAFIYIDSQLKRGRTEQQIAWMMEKYFREKGANSLAFPTIVASGKNSAIPHYQTGKRKIEANDIVLIDAGCKVNGYCSDMTRTFFIGKPKTEWLKIYNIVKEAQQKAINFLITNYQLPITKSVQAKKIDEICRNYITKCGYKKEFIHSTGHGIGLEVHEEPHINPESKTHLKPNMVFTLEPGVYLPGKFGVRIEDIVVY